MEAGEGTMIQSEIEHKKGEEKSPNKPRHGELESAIQRENGSSVKRSLPCSPPK